MARKSFVSDFMDGRWFWFGHAVLHNGRVLTFATDITALKRIGKILRQGREAALEASRTNLRSN